MLNSSQTYSYIDSKAASILKSIRIEHSAFSIEPDEILIDVVRNGFEIYTYAGHKVNLTLGLIIQYEFRVEFSITYNKLKVKRDEKKITEKYILDIFNRLKGNTIEIENIIEKALISSKFESHTKFYKHLPRFAQVEVLKWELVDIKKTVKVLNNSKISIENLYESI